MPFGEPELQVKEMHRTLEQMQREILKGGKGVEEDARFHTQLAKAAATQPIRSMERSASLTTERLTPYSFAR